MNRGCRPDPKTMPVTREYAEGHERIFGKTTRKTGRYVWDSEAKAMIPYEERRLELAAHRVVTDRYMEGSRTVDGIDISSRQKRNAYKKAMGVEDTSDFKETSAKARKSIEAMFTSGGDWRVHKERREDVGRAAYEVMSRKRVRR